MSRSSSCSSTSFARNSASFTPLALPASGRHNPTWCPPNCLISTKLRCGSSSCATAPRISTGSSSGRRSATTSSRATTPRRRSTTCARSPPRCEPRSRSSKSRFGRSFAGRRSRSVAAEGRSGGGRRALGRVVLVSLAERTRAELDERQARGQRLRAQRTARRLEELERALDPFDRGLAPVPTPWYLRWGAYGAAIVVLLAALVALVSLVAVHGPAGVLVGIADVALLVATLLWFSIAIARRAPREGVSGRHPNEGSSGQDEGR